MTKKGEEIAEKLSQTAIKTAETISRQSEQIASTRIYKTVAEVRSTEFTHIDMRTGQMLVLLTYP